MLLGFIYKKEDDGICCGSDTELGKKPDSTGHSEELNCRLLMFNENTSYS